jgi:hypothetical protein
MLYSGARLFWPPKTSGTKNQAWPSLHANR